MNRSARLIKEVLYRQLLKKRLRTAKGGVLTVEKLLSPGLCLLFTFNKINSSMLYTTCTITQYDGYATDIRVLQPRRLLTPALESYICSILPKTYVAFQLYPHLGYTQGEVFIV